MGKDEEELEDKVSEKINGKGRKDDAGMWEEESSRRKRRWTKRKGTSVDTG